MKIKIFILVFAVLSGVNMQAVFSAEKINLKRVEPANWWIGMKNPDLQLLVYGDNIGRTDVRFSIPGVRLLDITEVENKNYLFINLRISQDAKPGTYPIEFLKNNKVVAKYDFQLLEREKNSLKKGFNSSDVIYLLMPDRFSNSNPANDSVPGMHEGVNRQNPNGRHGGDIQGIINHLDYLQDLGITALWSTPLMEDNMEKYSYHTYAITDYYRIDPRFGTNADYRRLSDELHKRNMKLIMDVVTNHCGLNYWWMKDLPAPDWINQFKEFTRTNYQASTMYDPYASNSDKFLNTNGWFDHSMPDMNQDNPLVHTYLIQNTIWWIEYANLDGLRVDTYPFNDQLKMAQWTQAILNEYPGLNIVGECWVRTSQEIAYWQAGVKNSDGFVSTLPSVMDFALNEVFRSAFNEDRKFENGIRKFYDHFTLDFAFSNPNNILVFTENHDTQRFNKIIDGDLDKFKLAYALLFTIRGIPQFYYGSEILMTGDKEKGDGDIRRDFPGGWPDDKRNAFTASGRTAQENEAFDFIKKLLNWRKGNEVISNGKTTQFIPFDNYYVYFRYNDKKSIMVILNNGKAEQKIDTKRYHERMAGFTTGYDVISGKEINDLSIITIPAKTPMIIELK